MIPHDMTHSAWGPYEQSRKRANIKIRVPIQPNPTKSCIAVNTSKKKQAHYYLSTLERRSYRFLSIQDRNIKRDIESKETTRLPNPQCTYCAIKS